MERALIELFDKSQDGVGVLDAGQRCVYVNPAGCRILGQPLERLLAKADRIVGSGDQPVLPLGPEGDVRPPPSGRQTTMIQRPDGRKREIEFTITELALEEGRWVAWTFRDVTEDRRAERWARAFARINSGMATANASETILAELSGGVVDATGMVGCAVVVFDAVTGDLRLAGAHGLPGDYHRRFEVALQRGLDLPAVRAFRSAQTLVVRSSELVIEVGSAAELPWEVLVCVPMRVRGRVIGVLKAFLQSSLDPEPGLLGFLDAIADQAAMAMENVRLFAEATHTSRRQEALVRAGLALASEFDLPRVLTKIVELACEVADAQYGALGIAGEDGRLVDFITHGITEDQRAAMGRPPVGHGVLGALIADARPVRLRRLQDDQRSVGFPSDHPPMTSFLGVPVRVGGKVYGNLYLTEKRGAPDFTEADERAVVTLATQAGVTIENAQLFSEARDRLALEERTRLARELHDSVSQALFAMTLETGAASLALEQSGTDEAGLGIRLGRLRALTEGAHAEMRALIFELRPDAIREEGLVAAVRKHAAGMAAREEFEVVVDVDEVALPPVVEEQLYRLAQEALSNASKHSQARTVRIRLGAEGNGVVLEVEDDGVGFDPSRPRPGHLGMRSMLQRAQGLGGTLEVASQPGEGTCVRAVVPLTSEAAWQET